MRKRDLFLEPYEAPKIESLLAVVEQGFQLSEGAGNDPDGDDNWDQWDMSDE
jgi:hypothetical protein